MNPPRPTTIPLPVNRRFLAAISTFAAFAGFRRGGFVGFYEPDSARCSCDPVFLSDRGTRVVDGHVLAAAKANRASAGNLALPNRTCKHKPVVGFRRRDRPVLPRVVLRGVGGVALPAWDLLDLGSRHGVQPAPAAPVTGAFEGGSRHEEMERHGARTATARRRARRRRVRRFKERVIGKVLRDFDDGGHRNGLLPLRRPNVRANERRSTQREEESGEEFHGSPDGLSQCPKGKDFLPGQADPHHQPDPTEDENQEANCANHEPLPQVTGRGSVGRGSGRRIDRAFHEPSNGTEHHRDRDDCPLPYRRPTCLDDFQPIPRRLGLNAIVHGQRGVLGVPRRNLLPPTEVPNSSSPAECSQSSTVLDWRSVRDTIVNRTSLRHCDPSTTSSGQRSSSRTSGSLGVTSANRTSLTSFHPCPCSHR